MGQCTRGFVAVSGLCALHWSWRGGCMPELWSFPRSQRNCLTLSDVWLYDGLYGWSVCETACGSYTEKAVSGLLEEGHNCEWSPAVCALRQRLRHGAARSEMPSRRGGGRSSASDYYLSRVSLLCDNPVYLRGRHLPRLRPGSLEKKRLV